MRTLLKKDLKFYNEPVDLQIAAIRRDGGTQARAGLNEETVEDYMQAVDNQAHFPPVVVYHDGKDYWLADGFHRIEAYQRTGRMSISADMRQGTRRDAILHAAGANAAHGLRRTNADKRRAVETLLRDEEWSKWSDREIARMCAVSQPLVSQIRKTLTDNIISEKTYTTKHGTTTTMDTSNVGKKQPPMPAPEPEPEPEEEDIPEEAMQWAEGVLGVNQQPELPNLPPGWYYQDSSNPDDIIAINRNNHEQISGFCETHEQAAAAAWQVHLDQRLYGDELDALGDRACRHYEMLALQKMNYFYAHYEYDDRKLLYMVFWNKGAKYRILRSNIPAFINQVPGYESLMMLIDAPAETIDVDRELERQQPAKARIIDMPEEQREAMMAELESLGYDVKYHKGCITNNRKGAPGHMTENLYYVEEFEKRLKVSRDNFEREQQRQAERERMRQEIAKRREEYQNLPEQQPVAHPTIKQCMVDAYKLIKAGDTHGAKLQAERFRAHPDIAGIIGHAIWGMQCAMEEDSDG
jgi:hypothetical protein